MDTGFDPSAKIACNLPRRVRTRGAGEAAPWMRPGTAQVETSNRCAVLTPPEQRTHAQHLVERKLTMEDVSAREAVGSFQIKG